MGVKNMTKKITAFITALIICFSVCAPGAQALSLDAASDAANEKEYGLSIMENGYPAITTDQLLNMVKVINYINRFLTGRILIPEKKFNMTLDSMLSEASAYIFENSGFNIEQIITTLPETNQYSEFIVKAFRINTTEMRNQAYVRSKELAAEGKTAKSYILRWFSVWLSIIDSVEGTTIPVEGEDGVYEIIAAVTYKDGATDVIHSTIYYNPETGMVYGQDPTKGMLGLGYNFSVKEILAFSPINIWMRNFGFCLFYDIFSYTTPFFNYNTRRIKFDYDGLEWMIQVWKGNYLVSNGGEVGIYTRKPGSIGTFYNCATDEQMMTMSIDIYHDDELLMHRDPTLHWWLNGFVMDDTLYLAKSMTAVFSVEMKDEEMVNAFTQAIDKHYRHDMTYKVDGLKVTVTW